MFLMPSTLRASRLRYQDYRRKLKLRRLQRDTSSGDASIHGPLHGAGDPQKRKPRSRSFIQLFAEFWGMLQGFRQRLILVLIASGISTLLGLVPLYGTKIVFDSVLRERPLPPQVPYWIHLPHSPHRLLAIIAIAMVLLAAASEIVGLWSRWQTTRMTKRVQVSVRKTVFDHAVRLPLHRVYDLKSGGVASILREDAGGVADLIFSMLYTPFRAIIQLLGSLTILALVD
jgi:ATP-binding cassette subfamily B protein/subfamily B ATP-binding cassette protein MsbA